MKKKIKVKTGKPKDSDSKKLPAKNESISSSRKAGSELRESEIRFKSLFEFNPQMIFAIDKKGKVLSVNNTAVVQLGYSAKELIGKSVLNVFYKDDRRAVNKSVKDLLKGQNKKNNWQFRKVSKDGKVILVNEIARVVRWSGNREIILITCEDITKQKEADESLAKSEKRYRGLFENMMEGYAYCKMIYKNGEPQDFIYLAVNNNFEKLTGLKNVVGKKVTEVIPGIRESDPELFNIYSRVSLTGKPAKFEMFVEALKMWFSVSVYSPEKEYFVAVFDVITERKRAEEKIERLNRIYSLLSEVNQAIVRASEGEKLFNEICASAIKFGKFAYACLGLVNDEKKEITTVAMAASKNASFKFSKISYSIEAPQRDIFGRAIRNNTITVSNDINLEKNSVDSILNVGKMGFRSVAVVPINFEDKVFGLLSIYSSTPNYFDEEQIKLLNEVGTDISFALENLKAEKIMRESEIRLKNLFDYSPIGIVMLDKNEKILSINKGFETIFQYSIEEIKGKNINDVICSEQFFKEAAALSQKSLQNEVVQKESIRKRKDGSLVNVSIYGIPIVIDHKQSGLYGMYIDITERKKAEVELKESEEKFRNFAEESPNMIFINNAGRVVYANKKCEEIMGYTRKEFLDPKFNFLDLIAPEYVEMVKENFTKRYKGKAKDSYEYTLLTKDKTRIEVSIASTIIKYDGGNAILGTVTDISERKRAEKEIQQTVSLLEATLESTVDGILVVGNEGKILRFNQKFLEMWRIPDSIVASRSDDQALNYVLSQLQEPDQFLNKVKELYKQNMNESFDLLYFKDGRIFERFSRPQLIEGKPIGRVWSFRDITQRKQFENALKESEEKFRKFFETANEGICIADEGENFTMVNSKLADILGYSVNELIGMNFKDFLFQEDLKEHFKVKYERVVGRKGYYERRLHAKDGSTIWVDISASPIFDKDGQYKGTYAMFTDITERKIAEEDVRKLYRGVEQSPATVVITDKLGNIEYVNLKFTETTGYTLAEVIGKNPRILKSGERTKEEYKELWKIIISGNEWRGEFHNKRKNGELYWELASISPIKNEKGEITHFIAIKEDITERKQMIEELIVAKERAERSERIKSEFLAQMSHEIRTPINIILGFNSFIKEELASDVTAELSESFDSIESASIRIMRTVDMILNMSEIQTKTVTASSEVFNLDKEVLAALCTEYKKQAERKNLSFIYNLKADNTEIIADDYLVTHIFTNLLDNAVKYTDKGKIEIVVNRNDQNKLFVEVKDTGIGISKEFLPKIFDAFTQEEHGYSRKYEGNGLGLALVKNYCELNNTKIEVESTKGIGSTFRVTFP